jgi:DNA-binding NtrC family response regulator
MSGANVFPKPLASNLAASLHDPDQGVVSMPGTLTTNPDGARALSTIEDATVASQSRARLLITAPTEQGVEALARRIHRDGDNARFPFLHICAGDLPSEGEVLKAYCASLLAAAAGGSLLVSDVETMPPLIQDVLIDLLAELELAYGPTERVRLIAGTTVPLLDRVAAGAFSAMLFYRLNVIHLVADTRSPDIALA